MKRFPWLLAALALLLLAACGGGTQEGVELQAAARQQPSATPAPTVPASGDGALFDMSGRLLLVRGQTFELYDLATGETTVLDDVPTFSEAFLSADRLRAVFVAFPHYGLLDLSSGELREFANPSSNPGSITISPDGRWMASHVGAFRSQLRVFSLDDTTRESIIVASGSDTFFPSMWTADSKLVWWDSTAPDDLMIYDPEEEESAAAESRTFELAAGAVGVDSPDGSQSISIPVGFDDPDDPGACIDSYIRSIPLPAELGDEEQGETLWTEPGLVASSPQWLDDHRILFVKLGNGSCGEVEGDPVRQIMLYDLENGGEPRPVAGPVGNADDPNDESQNYGRQVAHLFSPSPDGRFVAWIGGGRQAGETTVNVTAIDTGSTQTLLRLTEAEASDLADYIEHVMFRQVVWLN